MWPQLGRVGQAMHLSAKVCVQCRASRRPAQTANAAADTFTKDSAAARSRKNRQGLAHISSGKGAKQDKMLVTAGHQLLHRRAEMSLYVRNVSGVTGHAAVVKNAGKEKGTASASVTTASAPASSRLSQQPRLLARCAHVTHITQHAAASPTVLPCRVASSYKAA